MKPTAEKSLRESRLAAAFWLIALGWILSATSADSAGVTPAKSAISLWEPLPDTSLYQVDSTWTTDRVEKIRLSSLAGRPQIVVMFFAGCSSTCPLLVHQLKQIEAVLPPDLATNTGFV
ncbi:MAG TPA: hypothetical protein VHH73_17110, partial [Verrucomicrobiae bacterium]|nr:hypothetical protein [Verrucomicrobiae bacterium]